MKLLAACQLAFLLWNWTRYLRYFYWPKSRKSIIPSTLDFHFQLCIPWVFFSSSLIGCFRFDKYNCTCFRIIVAKFFLPSNVKIPLFDDKFPLFSPLISAVEVYHYLFAYFVLSIFGGFYSSNSGYKSLISSILLSR